MFPKSPLGLIMPNNDKLLPLADEGYDDHFDSSLSYKRVSRNEEYDVIIRVGQGENREEFWSYSKVLRKSGFFAAALSSRWAKKSEAGLYVVDLERVEPDVFEIILKLSPSFLLSLLISSDELSLDDLTSQIQTHFLTTAHNWTLSNLVHLLNALYHYEGGFSLLRTFILDTVTKNPRLLFGSEEFGQLQEETVMDLVVKRTHELEHWTSDDCEKIKEKLSTLLEEIMFPSLSRNVYCQKIIPCAKLIPDDITNEVLDYYLRRRKADYIPIQPKVILRDSTIINHFHASIISKWIEAGNARLSRKPSSRIKRLSQQIFHPRSSYRFNLIFRKSRYGFVSEDYRSQCSGVTPMVVVAKVKNSYKLVGGYAPVGLNTAGAKKEIKDGWEKSFIFSFSEPEQGSLRDCAVMSRMVEEREGGYIPFSWFGPRFGSDLFINLETDRCVCRQAYYENSVMDESNFAIDDCEIFEVVKSDD
ncbi:5867_t:CDS:2 [Paraglomus occultum]|uniref:5867_t:CDS:1 n=1 Tax=Paraglomus occultum TaxID=144539 RepID=A0A9N9G9N9_9GLOM|nr:5867_t:CDS:2 [Paraglomus occultum]